MSHVESTNQVFYVEGEIYSIDSKTIKKSSLNLTALFLYPIKER